jgi:O-acetyl-ADP-ribose deacetylase
MCTTVGQSHLELLVGDITQQHVDAIVNAANQHLAGGGGVDGAIHRHGGPGIMAETERNFPHGCETGTAVVTSAGKLQAQYVIHAVGPRWTGGQRSEAELLRSAYRHCLELAVQHGCRSIAFPALSTGAYGYPLGSASQVALSTVIEFLQKERKSPEIVRFVLFSEETYRVFAETLQSLLPSAE